MCARRRRADPPPRRPGPRPASWGGAPTRGSERGGLRRPPGDPLSTTLPQKGWGGNPPPHRGVTANPKERSKSWEDPLPLLAHDVHVTDRETETQRWGAPGQDPAPQHHRNAAVRLSVGVALRRPGKE